MGAKPGLNCLAEFMADCEQLLEEGGPVGRSQPWLDGGGYPGRQFVVERFEVISACLKRLLVVLRLGQQHIPALVEASAQQA